MLQIEGVIADILRKDFGCLKTTLDWQMLHAVLTIEFEKVMAMHGLEWNQAQAMPVNTNDLKWKTRLRFLSVQKLKNFFLDGQKRGVSHICAMMGIRPVKRLVDCKVRDDKVRIPAAMNPLRSCDPELKKTTQSCLMFNQGNFFTMTIGLLNSNLAPKLGFSNKDIAFYKRLSINKAEAASKAEDRSWKDFALGLCDAPDVRRVHVPADFDEAFFVVGEGQSARLKKALKDVTSGLFLAEWGRKCIATILRHLYNDHHSKAFMVVMPKAGGPMDSKAFVAEMMAKMDSSSGSQFSFDKKIPSPQAVHALLYLVLLTAPATAWRRGEDNGETVYNSGLDTLTEVIRSEGQGQIIIADDCAECPQKEYVQTVS
jgi:hypothetical protein